MQAKRDGGAPQVSYHWGIANDAIGLDIFAEEGARSRLCPRRLRDATETRRTQTPHQISRYCII
jgi:hypothetical protein